MIATSAGRRSYKDPSKSKIALRKMWLVSRKEVRRFFEGQLCPGRRRKCHVKLERSISERFPPSRLLEEEFRKRSSGRTSFRPYQKEPPIRRLFNMCQGMSAGMRRKRLKMVTLLGHYGRGASTSWRSLKGAQDRVVHRLSFGLPCRCRWVIHGRNVPELSPRQDIPGGVHNHHETGSDHWKPGVVSTKGQRPAEMGM